MYDDADSIMFETFNSPTFFANVVDYSSAMSVETMAVKTAPLELGLVRPATHVNADLTDAMKAILDNAKGEAEDAQSRVQFEIQIATSDMQNAEQTRSQAEKRAENLRNSLQRNWAG